MRIGGRTRVTTMAEPRTRHERAIYSYAEADRIANVSRGTTKRWVTGYRYARNGERVTQGAVTTGEYDERTPGITFGELIEVAAIARLRDAGLGGRAIREIVDRCREVFGTPRPLSQLRFKTDGRETFVQVSEEFLMPVHGTKRSTLYRAWDQVLDPFLTTVDYQDGVAYRWWPDGRETDVVVDPDYGLGVPVVSGTGVRTEIINELFLADVSLEEIADDFQLTTDQVTDAIRFEARRRPVAA